MVTLEHIGLVLANQRRIDIDAAAKLGGSFGNDEGF